MDAGPDKITPDAPPVDAKACDLPLTSDLPLDQRPEPQPPQKDIRKTLGSKITHAFTYWGQGMIGNSGLSVAITYFLMPKEWVKKPKAAIAKAMSSFSKGETEFERMRSANNTLEILIMMVAGTVLTATMVPFAKNHEKISHWVNKKLGRDQDILPHDMQPVPAPRTLEEKIQQEVDKRVERHHTSGDVWGARWLALTVPFFGDRLLSRWNNAREEVGKTSVDTFAWEKGAQFYDNVLSKKTWVDKFSNFFEKHGAGVADIEKNAPEKYPKLLSVLKEDATNINKSRVMVAEQSRMLVKEVGWTIILAGIMEQLVSVFHNRRVKKEEKRAVEEVTKDGFVPEGYKVRLKEDVLLEPVAGTAPKAASWTEKSAAPKPRPEKSENFTAAVDTSRTAGEQPVLG